MRLFEVGDKVKAMWNTKYGHPMWWAIEPRDTEKWVEGEVVSDDEERFTGPYFTVKFENGVLWEYPQPADSSDEPYYNNVTGCLRLVGSERMAELHE